MQLSIVVALLSALAIASSTHKRDGPSDLGVEGEAELGGSIEIETELEVGSDGIELEVELEVGDHGIELETELEGGNDGPEFESELEFEGDSMEVEVETED